MAAEVVDVADRVAPFQHVRADECVEVADDLDADGLVEEVEGLLGAEIEGAAEPRAVVIELVEDLGSALAQPPLQLPDVRKAREVLGDA